MKNFFSITENRFIPEIGDLTAILTALNVLLIICGFWWAPLLGIVNCLIGLGLNIKGKTYINTYVMQFMLIILNVYFLI